MTERINKELDTAIASFEIPDLDHEESEIAPLNFRYYKKILPDKGECVVVRVDEIGPSAATVSLVEYGGLQGMLLLSELSKRRLKSVGQQIKVGKIEICYVYHIDSELGRLNVSKSKVEPNDRDICEDRYMKAKAVHSALSLISMKTGTKIEELYENIVWPLYDKFGHAYNAFKLAASGRKDVFSGIPIEFNIRNAIMNALSRRFSSVPVKIRAHIHVNCFSIEGIEAIKEALREGEKQGSSDCSILITLIATPEYSITTNMIKNEKRGIEIVNNAIHAISEKIRSFKGDLSVTMEPQALTKQEEILFMKESSTFLQEELNFAIK